MDDITALILALLAFTIGFLLAAFIFGGRSQAESKTEAPTGPSEDATPPAGVRTWRHPATDQLIVELDGQVITDRQALQPDQLARLSSHAGELLAWLASASPAGGAAAEPAAERPPAPANALAMTPAPPDTARPGLSAHQRPSLNPFKVFGRLLGRAGSPPVEAAPSIVTQVDEILQRKLPDSPAAGRAVHLVELPAAGMAVLVGLEKYESIEAIPEPEIRDLIRQAVAEWEARAGSR
jgi:hypothetical protein